MNLPEAVHRVLDLREKLDAISERDPDQEVQGIALPVIDAVLSDASDLLPADDPVVRTTRGLITPEAIEAGDPIRAVDASVVVGQLYAALKYANRNNEGPFIG